MKTLVVYGSKYGATEICAKRIAKGLKGEVDLINLKEQKEISLEAYDKVVIGSAVYAGMLRKEVKAFYDKYKEVLEGKKIAVFLSCMDDQGLNQYIDQGFSVAFREKLIAQAGCGGIFNFQKMNFLERFMMKQINKIKQKKEENTLAVDMKHNVENLSAEKIDAFVKAINLA